MVVGVAERRLADASELTSMTKSIPAGWHSVTPRLVVHDVASLVEFFKQAFGATGDFRPDIPCEIRIGDSLVMVSEVGVRDAMPAFLYLYVDDIDATYQRALKAGAESLEEPQDMPYGDRRCMVKDPGGNIWQIATHNEEAFEEFMRRRSAAQP
jgi:PhnB protein